MRMPITTNQNIIKKEMPRGKQTFPSPLSLSANELIKTLSKKNLIINISVCLFLPSSRNGCWHRWCCCNDYCSS